MKNKEFIEQTKQFFEECVNVMNIKGREYAGDQEDDKFANFKRVAKLQGIPVTSAWFTYFIKHFDSLTSFIRKRNQGMSVSEIEMGLSEPISGRIGDMINYLFILNGIIDEERDAEKNKIKERG